MSPRALTTFRIGAWSWVITGMGHLILAASLKLRPEDPSAAHAKTAMREYSMEFAGLKRSLYDLNQGMSLVMAVTLIFGGLVCLQVVRAAPDLVTQSRALTALSLAASLILLGLSAWLLPTPPVVLTTVASVAFGWTLAAARPILRTGDVAAR